MPLGCAAGNFQMGDSGCRRFYVCNLCGTQSSSAHCFSWWEMVLHRGCHLPLTGRSLYRPKTLLIHSHRIGDLIVFQAIPICREFNHSELFTPYHSITSHMWVKSTSFHCIKCVKKLFQCLFGCLVHWKHFEILPLRLLHRSAFISETQWLLAASLVVTLICPRVL